MTVAVVTSRASLISLSPANAPLLMLVVPIAMVGRRWGLRRAFAMAALALVLVGARTAISGGQIGIVGYLSRATAFVTVATLAGGLHQLSDRRKEHATSSVSPVPVLGRRLEDLLSGRAVEILALI